MGTPVAKAAPVEDPALPGVPLYLAAGQIGGARSGGPPGGGLSETGSVMRSCDAQFGSRKASVRSKVGTTVCAAQIQ